MKEVTATAQTVEEAVNLALAQLNVPKERAEIIVVDEGKKGFLGIFGARPAIVKAKLRYNPIEEAEKFLKSVVEKMGIQADIQKIENDKNAEFILSGEQIALLIGKHGQTLNSLQLLAQLVANRHSEHYIHITLDAENYRARRKETLTQLAQKLAEKAIKTGKEVKLEPLPAYERKIIHAALAERKGIKTYSVGTEPHRYIVISPIQ
ncbi:MAG TPA: RNA-binding cell elongation regulator Jag/EloR [Anoxybacillus sp.]|nr:RNA-binding cell elongation regulator Jag/EloR [Anoxybacillus sp.]